MLRRLTLEDRELFYAIAENLVKPQNYNIVAVNQPQRTEKENISPSSLRHLYSYQILNSAEYSFELKHMLSLYFSHIEAMRWWAARHFENEELEKLIRDKIRTVEDVKVLAKNEKITWFHSMILLNITDDLLSEKAKQTFIKNFPQHLLNKTDMRKLVQNCNYFSIKMNKVMPLVREIFIEYENLPDTWIRKLILIEES